MSLSTVNLVFTEQDAGGGAGAGLVTIAPTAAVVAAGQTVVSQVPVSRSLSSGTVTVTLVATDNTGTTPAKGYWAYVITLPGGQPQTYLVDAANGATQQFSNLVPATAQTVYAAVTAVSYPLALTLGGTGQAAASAAALLTALGAAALAGANFTGEVSPKVVTLTDAATIAVDASLGNDLRVTIAASRNMGNPSNPTDGQQVIFQVTQGSGGNFGITWGSAYSFGSGSAPALSTAAGALDMIGFKYNAAKAKWLYTGSTTGY